jgi:tetratricopeptide (TPR) repeat protein
LVLGPDEPGLEDARPRLEALLRSIQPQVSEEAKAEFRNGLTQADLGNPEEATLAFGAAFQMAPVWADAVYNRGVMRDRQGDLDEAVADFQQYLSLRPEGEDAIAVSQRIGQLQSSGPPRSPGTALTLGILIPGMGHFYSGRPKGGFAVLALAGGAAAVGFLVEKNETRCVGTPPQGGECPADRIINVETTNPYLTPSLIAAGAVTLLGAVEAFIKVRRRDSGGDEDLLAMNVGKARVVGPSVSATGRRLTLNLVQVTFR